MSEIDHEYTDEVVCPYCGNESIESHDFFYNCGDCSTEIECDNCGETFIAEQSISVKYYTEKKVKK